MLVGLRHVESVEFKSGLENSGTINHCSLFSAAVYKNWEVTKDLAISRKLLFMNGVKPTFDKRGIWSLVKYWN